MSQLTREDEFLCHIGKLLLRLLPDPKVIHRRRGCWSEVGWMSTAKNHCSIPAIAQTNAPEQNRCYAFRIIEPLGNAAQLFCRYVDIGSHCRIDICRKY